MHETTALGGEMPAEGTDPEEQAGVRLERCPSCDYELAGSRAGRCPECGLQYDEHSRVWRPRQRFLYIRATIIAGIIVPICAYHEFGDELQNALGGLLWPLAGAWFLLMLSLMLWTRFLHRHRYQVATLPEGLLVRCHKSELIPWGDITSIQVTIPEVRIFRSTGRCVGLALMFANLIEKEAFADHLTEARQRAKAPPLSAPPRWSARRLFYAAMRW
jgi:hypothetical protein